MALRIVIRLTKDYLVDKRIDPAIITIDEQGKNVISTVSGHLGGANQISHELAEEYFDLDKIYEIASSGADITGPIPQRNHEPEFAGLKVGIAYDQAFNFYYQSDLDLLEELGVELIYFSPLKAEEVPEVESLKDNLLLKTGQKAKGHLFHYSQVSKKSDEIPLNYKLDQNREGYSFYDNLLASYLHINFAAQPEVLKRFLKKAENYKSSFYKSSAQR